MIIGSLAPGVCADWKLFYTVSEGPKFYFDKEGIVQPQKEIVQVWFKVMSEEGSDEVEVYKAQVEINCKSKSHKFLEESTSDNVSQEESKQQSISQAHRRFSLESTLGSLWSNVCPTR
jgi:hypothetical protein